MLKDNGLICFINEILKESQTFPPTVNVCGKAVVCLSVLRGDRSPLEISTLFWLAWLHDTAR